MNKSQREYVLERVDAILGDKIEALAKKLIKPAIRLTPEQRAKALYRGKFKIRPGLTEIDRYATPDKVFVFEDERPEKRSPDYDRAVASLRVRAQVIKDEIVLGDTEKALRLLREFEKAPLP